MIYEFELEETAWGTWLARSTPTHDVEVTTVADHAHVLLTSKTHPGEVAACWCYLNEESGEGWARALVAIAQWDGNPGTCLEAASRRLV